MATRHRGPWRWIGVLLATVCGSVLATTSPPTFVLLDDALLDAATTRLRQGDPLLVPAQEALMRRATKALQTRPRSVTDKTALPPSGDKRDYVSRGPYWWPNPATPNGLPYVRRDGQRNPEVTDGALDSDRLQAMVADVRDLALAWRFSGEDRYAAHGAAMLRTWFLDPATRMNPHLRFAQGIPGIVEGRGIGLIDTRDLAWVIDSAALLARAGALAADEREALRRWFADYVRWMLDSELGREEAAAYNNHGLFYDAQVVAFLVHVGEPVAARRIVLAARTLRLASQIDREGRLPFELERTRPFHYTAFTLQAATRLARHGRSVIALADTWPASDPRCQHAQWRCPVDLWRGGADGRSLPTAIATLALAVLSPASLVAPTAVEPKPPLASALSALLLARTAIEAPLLDKALAVLRQHAPEDVHWLVWPPP